MEPREQAKEIVMKIVDAERMGGGFRTYFENAINRIEAILVENAKLKSRLKYLDDLHQLTVVGAKDKDGVTARLLAGLAVAERNGNTEMVEKLKAAVEGLAAL